jgi:deoxycytidylate deaminase
MVEVFTQTDVLLAQFFGSKNSPCSRRKYGTIIKDNFGNFVFGTNSRIGKICTDDYCVRDGLNVPSGSNAMTEQGGELHSEQAALIEWRKIYNEACEPYHILLAGTNRFGNLLGLDSRPCYSCARMIKYAGFDDIWLPFVEGPRPVSVSEVIESYERIYQNI